MKRSVGILLFDGAEVLDFAGPFEVFSVASEVHDFTLFDVRTVGRTLDPVIAINGLSVNPDYELSNCPGIDILILPGGSGTRALMEDKEIMAWIQERQDKAEITMSICSGARMLGKLGLLDDRPYCTHHQVYDDLKAIVPIGQPKKELRYVESSAGVFTSGGISAGIDLSFHVVSLLHGEACAKATAGYMEYDLSRSNA